MAGLSVNGLEVVVGVGAAFGERDAVVDLVGAEVAADAADEFVALQDLPASPLLS